MISPILVPKRSLGTHVFEARLREAYTMRMLHLAGSGSGASRTCVPKRSLGTRMGGVFLLALGLLVPAGAVSADEFSLPRSLQKVTFEQRLNEQLPLDLSSGCSPDLRKLVTHTRGRRAGRRSQEVRAVTAERHESSKGLQVDPGGSFCD